MKTSIIWLAGIIDGEGCIYARFVNPGKYKSNPLGNLESRVTIQANSERMIDTVQEIYAEYEIEFCRNQPRLQPLSTRKVHKIEVFRKTSVQKLLALVVDHLRVKDREARVLLAFFHEFPAKYDQVSTPEQKQALVIKLRDLKKIA